MCRSKFCRKSCTNVSKLKTGSSFYYNSLVYRRNSGQGRGPLQRLRRRFLPVHTSFLHIGGKSFANEVHWRRQSHIDLEILQQWLRRFFSDKWEHEFIRVRPEQGPVGDGNSGWVACQTSLWSTIDTKYLSSTTTANWRTIELSKHIFKRRPYSLKILSKF